MKRVLFIIPPYTIKNIDADQPKVRSFYGFPYGVLSMATYNKNHADIHIVDCDPDQNYLSTIVSELQNFNPDIIGISLMFDTSYKYLADILNMINSGIIVLGGASASYSYQEMLIDKVDGICFGEGEIPFRHLIETGTMDHPAWVTKKRLGSQYQPIMETVVDLDEVIDIDYTIQGIDIEAYQMKEAFSPYVNDTRKKQFFLMTSRGCPFKCAFCSNSKIHGKKMRFASVDAIQNHVDRLVSPHYNMEVLTIYDDQMLIDMPRAKDIFRMLSCYNLRVEAPNGFSVAFIDQEMAYLMKKAGMDTVYLAIESGSPYVLKELIHKPLKLEMVKPVIEMLHKAGLFVHGFFVFGMPGETPAHRRETYNFIRESGLDWAGLNMATPVRGSQLYEDCIKNGWIQKQEILDIVDKKYIIRMPGIEPVEIEAEVYQMNIDLNFHYNRRMCIGDYETAANCFAQVLQRYPGHRWAKDYLRFCEHKMRGL